MVHLFGKRVGTALAAAVTLTAAAVPAQAETASDVQWTTRDIAPGVQVRTGVLERAASTPWTVTVLAPATNRLTGAATLANVGSQSWAEDTANRLNSEGFQARVESVPWPDYADTPHGVMGWRVRVGSYATQAEAQSESSAVGKTGVSTTVDWTGYDADQAASQEHIHLAVIDPQHFTGTVVASHGGTVAQRTTTSAMAASAGALVGVNGGFFVTSDSDGIQGAQAGLGAYNGQPESESSGARAALVLNRGGARIANLTSTVTARAGQSEYAVQGINRVPGLVRDCGRPGLTPTDLPRQDVTCHATDDLVLFTPALGTTTPTGPGTQATLDSSGRVLSVGARGGPVPPGGSVLQGIGAAAGWLSTNARPGVPLTVHEDIRDASGARLGNVDSIVSAAPVLVRDGRIDIDAATEGTVDPADLSFGYAWANVRQPRTMVGIDQQGRLLMATVDGREPGTSEGFTLEEAAQFMRSLGAVQAMNLDGGGSTAMAVNGKLVNTPSDATGERAVGDTVLVLPPR
jgi:exopolysaccharide biosynthesis protein